MINNHLNKFLEILKENVDKEDLNIQYINDFRVRFIYKTDVYYANRTVLPKVFLKDGILSNFRIYDDTYDNKEFKHFCESLNLAFRMLKIIPFSKTSSLSYLQIEENKEYFLFKYLIGDKITTNNKNILITNIPELNEYHNLTFDDDFNDKTTVLSLKNLEDFDKIFTNLVYEAYIEINPDKSFDDFKIAQVEHY